MLVCEAGLRYLWILEFQGEMSGLCWKLFARPETDEEADIESLDLTPERTLHNPPRLDSILFNLKDHDTRTSGGGLQSFTLALSPVWWIL